MHYFRVFLNGLIKVKEKLSSLTPEDYCRMVGDGYAKMKTYRVAICATVRDCDFPLKRNIPLIEKLRACFQESYVVIVENDSKDHTKEVLSQWVEQAKRVFVLSQDTGEKTIPMQCEGGGTTLVFLSSY